MSHQTDPSSPLTRALASVAGLKAGSWDSVEALAVLAVEARDLPDSARLLETAHQAAANLKVGTWQAVRALALLARADRELGR